MLTNNSCPHVSIPPATENSNPVVDPFDPSRLRLSQDFVAAAGVKKAPEHGSGAETVEGMVYPNERRSKLPAANLRHRVERGQRDVFGRSVAVAGACQRIDVFTEGIIHGNEPTGRLVSMANPLAGGRRSAR